MAMANAVINDMNDPEFRKLLAQEELILEVTETICELLENEKVSRKGLADRLGKTKGFISQLLNGGRNLTLRTVADILHALGYKVSLNPQKNVKQRHDRKIIEFPIQTIYQKPVGQRYIQQEELEFSCKADNYPISRKTISR
jgi:transcriptional regulator with XRE-family HTH domain